MRIEYSCSQELATHVLVSVASAALFVYDYIITFEMEFEFVWKSPWNVVKVLYFIQRYMPFADVAMLPLLRKSRRRSWSLPMYPYKHQFILHLVSAISFVMSATILADVCLVPPFLTSHLILLVRSGMFIVGIAVSECKCSFPLGHIQADPMGTYLVILTLRTWAVWRRDRRLSYALPVFYVLCWAPNFAVMGLFLRSINCECRSA